MADAISEMMDCLTNPVKVKILVGIEQLGQATAKQLLDLCNDLSQATVYRALNKLTALKLIQIAEENPKRGTVEKVYRLNESADLLDAERIVRENDGEAYLGLFLAFLRSLLGAFGTYAKRSQINIMQDGSGFSASQICVTREELDELGQKIAETIVPYRQNGPAENRQNHTLALIFTPPTEKGAQI